MSYGVPKSQIDRDEAGCTRRCPGAHLYYGSIHSEYPNEMVNLTGAAYVDLENANLFRSQYLTTCKCKPHPWEHEAIKRHQQYAIDDRFSKNRRGGTVALEERNLPTRSEANARQ